MQEGIAYANNNDTIIEQNNQSTQSIFTGLSYNNYKRCYYMVILMLRYIGIMLHNE